MVHMAKQNGSKSNNNNGHQQVEHFDYGVKRWWLDDGKIAVIKTQGDMSIAAVDDWARILIEMLGEWQHSDVIAVLHDYRAPQQGMTPHTRRRALEVFRSIPDDKQSYTAILLPKTFIYQIIRAFVRSTPFSQSRHAVRVFTDERAALNWLRERIANHQTD